MIDSSQVPVLVAFCSALAAAGAFGIQFRRLWLERAALVVTAADWSDDSLTITLLNVGGRPAYDVEVSCTELRPDYFTEGIEVLGERLVKVAMPFHDFVLHVKYSDQQSGRIAEDRKVTLVGGVLGIGKRKSGLRLDADQSHVLPAKSIEYASK